MCSAVLSFQQTVRVFEWKTGSDVHIINTDTLAALCAARTNKQHVSRTLDTERMNGCTQTRSDVGVKMHQQLQFGDTHGSSPLPSICGRGYFHSLCLVGSNLATLMGFTGPHVWLGKRQTQSLTKLLAKNSVICFFFNPLGHQAGGDNSTRTIQTGSVTLSICI